MKKDGHETLRGKSFAIGKLHKSVMGTEIEGNAKKNYYRNINYKQLIGAHRALPDVLAMECILTHPSVVQCLDNLTIGAHQALPDVLAKECILTHPSLDKCLDNLTKRSPRTQMKL